MFIFEILFISLSWIRIRIPNKNPDPGELKQLLIHANPDPKH
jgi:hypothetical protein